MRRRPPPPAVDLAGWDGRPAAVRNRLVLEWLSDDTRRAELYATLRGRGGHLWVPSAARRDRDAPHAAVGAEQTRRVLLLADPEAVAAALQDGRRFSNAPYERLGSGDFLLGLDPQADEDAARQHAAQARALGGAFHAIGPGTVSGLARWSARAAVTALLGQDRFDLAVLAEHAALRFVQVLYGFPGADLPETLERGLRDAYRAMTVQMLGRHFVVEPGAIPAGRRGLALIARRSAELMREFALGAPGWPEGLETPDADIPALVPVLAQLADGPGGLDPADLAVVVAGSLAGTVGNVQAAVCIVLRALLADLDQGLLQPAIAAAHTPLARSDAAAALWADHIAPALRAHPPAPFLPRRLREPVPAWDAQAGEDVVLCVGAATARLPPGTADALVFGLDAGTGLHACTGASLARTMIAAIVAEVLRLPGLAERLDEGDGAPIGLAKRWGFACERYPLQHRRDERVLQQPLNVYMRVRQPLDQHLPALRALLLHGADRITRLLRRSRHVHFAWFELLDDGHVLALHTVFDGDFEAYLEHFAKVADTLFDELFSHLDPPLARPVAEAPEEFVRHVLAHHRPALGGFFYSHQPTQGVDALRAALPPPR